MEPVILHLNVVGFGVAVERLCDPGLRRRPVLIAPPISGARVLDMSDEAWRDGVRKHMSLARARRRCPRAVVLPPDPERYRKAMALCLRQARAFSPRVEQAPGLGHLFLDVSGTHRLFGPPPDTGWRLRKILRQNPGLNPVWAVAPNRLLARVAGRLVKPAGEYVIAAGEEAEFLDPLDLSLLPGLGERTLLRLREAGLRTIGQAARLHRRDLFLLCGRARETLYQNLRGLDPEPARDHHRDTPLRCHFSSLLPADSNRDQQVRAVLHELTHQAGRWLRGRGLGCRRLVLILEHGDRVRVRRTVRRREPVDTDRQLLAMADQALTAAWRRRVRIRRLSLSCDLLLRPRHQLSLFAALESEHRKNQSLDRALDHIQTRFGDRIIGRGAAA